MKTPPNPGSKGQLHKAYRELHVVWRKAYERVEDAELEVREPVKQERLVEIIREIRRILWRVHPENDRYG